jgi:hypothetical protein
MKFQIAVMVRIYIREIFYSSVFKYNGGLKKQWVFSLPNFIIGSEKQA